MYLVVSQQVKHRKVLQDNWYKPNHLPHFRFFKPASLSDSNNSSVYVILLQE